MRRLLSTILISVIVFTVLVNVPIKYFSYNYWFNRDLGALSTTDVQTTDNLSDWPTLYNANLAILDSELLELADFFSTTTISNITALAGLTTVGTIGTGVWEATDVGVAHGGTGKSAWTQYLIPYADTTTSFSQIPIGTNGQVLTSNGAGSVASFQDGTINQNIAYDFTNNFSISGSSYFADLAASSTVNFAGVDLIFPSSQGAASTTLKTTGSGNLIWDVEDMYLMDEVVLSGSATYATTTFTNPPRSMRAVIFVPSSTNDQLALRFNGNSTGAYTFRAYFDNEAATAQQASAQGQINFEGTATTTERYMVVDIHTDTSQRTSIFFHGYSGTTNPYVIEGSGAWNNNAALTDITLLMQDDAPGQTMAAGTYMRIYGLRE